MLKWTRRQALRTLTATSILTLTRQGFGTESLPSAFVPALADPKPITQLNVFLHGLMTMEISASNGDAGIILTFPEVPDDGSGMGHQYQAGSLDRTQTRPAAQLPPFQNTDYFLRGVKRGSKPVFTFNEGCFIIDNSDNSIMVARKDKRTLTLPWPKSKRCLRLMCRGDNQALLKKVPSGDPNVALKKTTTIRLLTYDLQGIPVIRDKGGKLLVWAPLESISGSGYLNLHIFAEPNIKASVDHAIDAFARMMKIVFKNGSSLDQQYTFDDYLQDDNIGLCQADPTLDGVDPTLDLLTLARLQVQAGGEVANCMSAIINVP